MPMASLSTLIKGFGNLDKPRELNDVMIWTNKSCGKQFTSV